MGLSPAPSRFVGCSSSVTALFPWQHPCGRSRDAVPGEPGLSMTRPPVGAFPRAALHPASTSPWIFKAFHCHELITGCAAAASSAIYIISRFTAFALLLIYRSHLLTPTNPRVLTPVIPSTRQKPQLWGWCHPARGQGCWHCGHRRQPPADGAVRGTRQSMETAKRGASRGKWSWA